VCVLNKDQQDIIREVKNNKKKRKLFSSKIVNNEAFEIACQQLGIKNDRRKRLSLSISKLNNNAIKSVTFVAVITVLTLYCCYLSFQNQSIIYAIPYSHLCERNKK